MSVAIAKLMPDGQRLHLHHGPIDLIISADCNTTKMKDKAYEAAKQRFHKVLEELVCELPILRTDVSNIVQRPKGSIARRMVKAVEFHSIEGFITPMAAVAGSVAEEILNAMTESANLERAFVNNGGDIAIHLSAGTSYRIALADLKAKKLGIANIDYDVPIRGIATSGKGGRSYSLGIADSVTVLAKSASVADAAATMIANAVDLPHHPAIKRVPANSLDPDSDLGKLPVVVECGVLTCPESTKALKRGVEVAEKLYRSGVIAAAVLILNMAVRAVGNNDYCLQEYNRRLTYA